METASMEPRIYHSGLALQVTQAKGIVGRALTDVALGNKFDPLELDYVQELLDQLVADASVLWYKQQSQTLGSAEKALEAWEFLRRRLPEIENRDESLLYLDGISDALEEFWDTGSPDAGGKVREFFRGPT